MAFFKIIFDNNTWKDKHRNPVYVKHANGDQMLFSEIDELIGERENSFGFPLCYEIDGWGDDQACIGDVYETDEGFSVECITEEEFRERTGQENTPYHMLVSGISCP